MDNNSAGISLITFIAVVAVSLGYYQFIYLPEANAKPNVPEEIAEPSDFEEVVIVEGSALPSNPEFFDPEEIRGTLGVSNKIVWKNSDVTAHTVTSDDDYEDKLSGKFDSIDTIGLIPPGEEFEFIFTEDGEFPYHCEPHPWMTGKVVIIPNFG